MNRNGKFQTHEEIDEEVAEYARKRRNAQKRAWSAANPEKKKASAQRYLANNPEKRKKTNSDYYQRNKPIIAHRRRVRVLKDPKKEAERQKEYKARKIAEDEEAYYQSRRDSQKRYYAKNAEKKKRKQREYYRQNREAILARARAKRRQKRKSTMPTFKFTYEILPPDSHEPYELVALDTVTSVTLSVKQEFEIAAADYLSAHRSFEQHLNKTAKPGSTVHNVHCQTLADAEGEQAE